MSDKEKHMTLNEWAKEIHENAVSHGWWETDREVPEIIALCHSELSEALEAFRDKEPLMWRGCDASDGYPCHEGGCGDWYDGKCELESMSPKPEGIAIELVDCVIRILDYCGYARIDIEEAMGARRASDKVYGMSIPGLICRCHNTLSIAFSREETRGRYFADCIILIRTWLDGAGLDMKDLILMKHEYNKTRPYRHGGKVV